MSFSGRYGARNLRSILEGSLEEQASHFSALLLVTSPGPLPFSSAAAAHLPLIGCIVRAHSDEQDFPLQEGLTVLSMDHHESMRWRLVDDPDMTDGYLVHVPGSVICELDETCTLRVWPLEDFHGINRRKAIVGRLWAPLSGARSLATPTEREYILSLLAEHFSSENRLASLLRSHFPDIARRLSARVNREQRIELLLATASPAKILQAIQQETEKAPGPRGPLWQARK